MLMRNLRPYFNLLSDYTELRLQRNESLSIFFIKGNLARNEKNVTSGVSARVRKNGSWGFASHTELNDEAIRMVIESAKQNAHFFDTRLQKGKPPFEPRPFSSVNDFSTKKARLSQKEIMDFIKELDAYIVSKYPQLDDRMVGLNSLDMEKSLINSDGSSRYSLVPRSHIFIRLTQIKDGEPVQVGHVCGGRGQFEDVFSKPDDLFSYIDEAYEHLMKKCEGVYPEAGLKECILDAELAGILAHEAIGHTTEADLVLGGSVAGDYIGKQVASELITLVDYANTYNGEVCPVPVYVDDEGTKAEDAVIIENGVLKEFMHNKETAQHFGVKAKGNARAFTYSDEPLIRMRNTAIVPGTSKLTDMIASIEDGYYLIKPSNGQADTTSEFMFGVVLGYEIKNGKLGRAIKDTTISGVAFDVLKSVTMVSDDMSWNSAGMCGKKQPIPVGMGGPAIKCKVNIGGR